MPPHKNPKPFFFLVEYAATASEFGSFVPNGKRPGSYSLCEPQGESRIAKFLTRLQALIGYFRMRKDMTLVPKVLFTFLPGHVGRLITSSFLLCSLSAK